MFLRKALLFAAAFGLFTSAASAQVMSVAGANGPMRIVGFIPAGQSGAAQYGVANQGLTLAGSGLNLSNQNFQVMSAGQFARPVTMSSMPLQYGAAIQSPAMYSSSAMMGGAYSSYQRVVRTSTVQNSARGRMVKVYYRVPVYGRATAATCDPCASGAISN